MIDKDNNVIFDRVGLGDECVAGANRALALGIGAYALGEGSVAIQYGVAKGFESIAIGRGAIAEEAGEVAIGPDLRIKKDGTLVFKGEKISRFPTESECARVISVYIWRCFLPETFLDGSKT